VEDKSTKYAGTIECSMGGLGMAWMSTVEMLDRKHWLNIPVLAGTAIDS